MTSKYEIKNYKSLKTRDGIAWTSSLYRDNKKVADLEDQGNGGSISIMWVDGHWTNKAESKMLNEWFLNNCDWHWTSKFINSEYSDADELAINLLDDIRENNKKAKNRIIFRTSNVVETDERGMVIQIPEYTMAKTTIADANALYYIVNKYPNSQVWDSSVQRYVNTGELLMKVTA